MTLVSSHNCATLFSAPRAARVTKRNELTSCHKPPATTALFLQYCRRLEDTTGSKTFFDLPIYLSNNMAGGITSVTANLLNQLVNYLIYFPISART